MSDLEPLDDSPEQGRWPGMPENILNMDWEGLLDLIQEVRENLVNTKDSRDAKEFVIDLGQKLVVDGVMDP